MYAVYAVFVCLSESLNQDFPIIFESYFYVRQQTQKQPLIGLIGLEIRKVMQEVMQIRHNK